LGVLLLASFRSNPFWALVSAWDFCTNSVPLLADFCPFPSFSEAQVFLAQIKIDSIKS